MNLIITEKIDAGCQVAEALFHLGNKSGDFGAKWADIKKQSARKGYLQGGDYLILWTNGHLGLDVSPGQINETYSLKFSYDKDFNYKMPNLLEQMKRAVKSDKKQIAKLIKDTIKKHNFNNVYICTDADAEGERIARDALFLFGGLNKSANVKRMWITGAFNTPKVIQEQLQSAKPYNDKKYENLYQSQLVRSTGDFIQGMKSTKCLVDVYGAKLYSGRVKNTIIGLIGDRELEIKNFTPKEYYIINSIGKYKMNHFYMKDVDDVDKDGNLVSKLERATQYFNADTKDKVVKELREVDLKGKVTGCRFSIFKKNNVLGRELTEQELELLCEKGSFETDDGMVAQLDIEGKYLLSIKRKDGSTNFTPGAGANKDEIYENTKTFVRNGITIWKDFRGKELTKLQAKKLFDGKKVKVKRKSKGGNDYELNIFLDDSNKIQGEFA